MVTSRAPAMVRKHERERKKIAKEREKKGDSEQRRRIQTNEKGKKEERGTAVREKSNPVSGTQIQGASCCLSKTYFKPTVRLN